MNWRGNPATLSMATSRQSTSRIVNKVGGYAYNNANTLITKIESVLERKLFKDSAEGRNELARESGNTLNSLEAPTVAATRLPVHYMGSKKATDQIQGDIHTLGKYPIRVRVRVRDQLPTART